MAKKLQRYNVELGAAFTPGSGANLYIDNASQSGYSMETVNVTPGNTVTMLDFVLEVPTNASKLLKITMGESDMIGLFLDANNHSVSKAYRVYEQYGGNYFVIGYTYNYSPQPVV